MRTKTKPPLPSKQYTRDSQWIVRHYGKLSLEYPNKWVAVHKGRVVAVADDLGAARAAAQERTGSSDMPIQFVDDGTIIF